MRNYILKNIISIFNLVYFSRNEVTVITFTGGMGAQVISAAIYFHLRDGGQKVFADLSYFNKKSHIAIPGKEGDISHWDWQLQYFGIMPDFFEELPKKYKGRSIVIKDGKEKSELGFEALRTPRIQQYFAQNGFIEHVLPKNFSNNYLCMHIRRGDYVNVASHLIDDDSFLELANQLNGLIENVVLVSDSPITDNFRKEMLNIYSNTIFLDNVDAITAHSIMRNARVLVCSNSQFSLIAAILNRRGLIFLPTVWAGKESQELGLSIGNLCKFQVLSAD
jgi:hypothetical protein